MNAEQRAILIIGCFDTKHEDFSFLYNCIAARGEKIISINTGILETPQTFCIDIDAKEVAAQGGDDIEQLRLKRDRGYAVGVMGKGAAKIVARLVAENRIKGAIGMGGGAGTFLTLTAMQPIPIGIPKFCVSTLAGKDVARELGPKDITLMPSIVDVAGLNSISIPLISQAAAAICAMANVQTKGEGNAKGRIAISMFGNTTTCVNHCTKLLREKGYEVFAFHANGVGGIAMESLINEGLFNAVLDITTTELADELCGGICSAGDGRLTAAARMGIPQVIAPGCIDMVNFAQPETVPDRYKDRLLYNWSPVVTLLRTNIEENHILGGRIAERINKSSAPVTVLIPLKGISQVGVEGGIFYFPEANKMLFDTIKNNIAKHIKLIEVNAHINDEEFSALLVQELLALLENKSIIH